MKAWVIREAGGPEKFNLEERATPKEKSGWVLIRIRAFGLNRSEWFTRIGDSPTVKFPKVLGIECVGEVVDAGDLVARVDKLIRDHTITPEMGASLINCSSFILHMVERLNVAIKVLSHVVDDYDEVEKLLTEKKHYFEDQAA